MRQQPIRGERADWAGRSHFLTFSTFPSLNVTLNEGKPQRKASAKTAEVERLLDVGDAMHGAETLRVQVSVREGHQPPAHGEEEPAADEGGGEDDEREAPLEVHQRGEDVLQEAALLADVLVRQVARAVLGDEARLVDAVAEDRLAGHAGHQPRQPKLLRDDAFPSQHDGFAWLASRRSLARLFTHGNHVVCALLRRARALCVRALFGLAWEPPLL